MRALLIALLLIGSTGSARCQVICAQLPDSQPTADTRPAKVATPDHGGCHGPGVASSEPLPERSGEPCEGGCCTVLTRAATAPISSPGPASAPSPMLAGVDLDDARIGPDRLRRSRPAARLKSPFHFRNPPLLI